MARHQGARRIPVEAKEERRAPQAFSTGEYDFFRGGDAQDVTAVHLPVSSAGWVIPLVGICVLFGLTVLLLS